MPASPAVRCSAKSPRTGEQCRAYAMHGTTVCNKHGGSAPQVRRAAQRRLNEEGARKALAKLGETGPVLDPMAQLARVAGEVVAFKNLLAEKIGDDEELNRADLDAYERALDRTVRALAEMSRLGFEARQTSVAEAEVDLLLEAVTRTMEALGLSTEQEGEFRLRFAGELRALEAVAT